MADETSSVKRPQSRDSRIDKSRMLVPKDGRLPGKSDGRKGDYKPVEKKSKDKKASYSRQKRDENRKGKYSVSNKKPKSEGSKSSGIKKAAGSSKKSAKKATVKARKPQRSSGKSSTRKERR